MRYKILQPSYPETAPPLTSEGKMNTQEEIAKVCDDLKNLLQEKNEKYGDSALNPVRVFSKASPVEQILVRMDDKISRLQRGAGLREVEEDAIVDLLGYLVLLKIAISRENQ